MYYLPNDLLMACILLVLFGFLFGLGLAAGQSLFGRIHYRLMMWNYHRRRAQLEPVPTKEEIAAWEEYDRLYPDAEGAAEEMRCGSEECRANCGETAEDDLQQRIDAHLEAARVAAEEEGCACGCENAEDGATRPLEEEVRNA